MLVSTGSCNENNKQGNDNFVPENKLHILKMHQWNGSGWIDKITKGHYKIMAFCNL
jgi:hypothetical protein